jgi:tRNA (mo5U34)-methyltransferase
VQWYHTIELAPGNVTPGWFDLRGVPEKLPLPGSLAGRRCLDVGTFDGFWAFELERRGAEEVVAVDLLDPARWDWPEAAPEAVHAALAARKRGGEGFVVAREALGSSVTRVERSVYELDPDELGEFDLVYVGSLLLHLRDPVRALERVRRVCRGVVLVVDAIDPVLTALHPLKPLAGLDGVGRPWWWLPNAAGLRQMVQVAGFEAIGPVRRVTMPPGAGQRRARPSLAQLRSRAGRRDVLGAWRGDPHAAVLARPC